MLLGVGIAIEIAGFVGDTYWHTVLDIHEIGIVPPPFWIILLGMVVALIGVVKGRATSVGTQRSIYAAGIVGAVGQLIGVTWDNYLHLNGIEPAVWAPPHALSRAGFLVLIALGIVLVLQKQFDVRAIMCAGDPRLLPESFTSGCAALNHHRYLAQVLFRTGCTLTQMGTDFTTEEIKQKYDESANKYAIMERVQELLGVRKLRQRLLRRASGEVLLDCRTEYSANPRCRASTREFFMGSELPKSGSPRRSSVAPPGERTGPN